MYVLAHFNRLRAQVLAAVFLASTASAALAQGNTNDLPPGVVASQGGVQVSLQDIDAYAAKIPEKDRGGFFDSPKRIENVIMGLLLKKQLAAEARAAKLDAEPDVQAQIRQATDDTLARVDLEHFRKNLKLPDFGELAHEYYLSHPDEYIVRGEIDVKHVLVSTKDRSKAEAQSRIDEVEATAKAHPDQFDALLEKYSDDPSKKDNHGLIENATSGKMVERFAKAAEALKKPGDISPVVESSFGYHVLKLISRKPDTKRSFEDVRPALVEKLRNDWIDQQVAEHTGAMRGNKLDASPDLVASLRTRFLPPGAVTPEQAQRAADEAAAKKKAAESAADKNGEAQH